MRLPVSLVILAWFTVALLACGQSSPVEKITPEERAEIKQLIREELASERSNAKETTASPHLDWIFKDGLVASSSEGEFRWHFGGRMDYDNAWYTQDQNILIGPNPGTVIQDGTTLRRARLRADATVWKVIDFCGEFNFVNIQEVPNVFGQSNQIGSVGITELNMTFRDLPVVGNLRVGHFKAAYSLENFSSSRWMYYMERSSVFDTFFNNNQFQNGIMVFDAVCEDRMTYAATFTRINKTTVNNFGFGSGDGLYSVGGRVTGLPVYENEGHVLVHLGANVYHQALAGNQFALANRMPLRAGAGSTQVPNIVQTGDYFTSSGVSVVDFEFAAIAGPFSLSAEFALSWLRDSYENFNGVTFSGPRGPATYHAFYVEAGCILTPGDHRSYDRKNGIWDRTRPHENAILLEDDGKVRCGLGAIEAVLRYAQVDLLSGSPVLTPASGGARAGRQHDVTAGLTWHLNSQTFVMLNYVWTHLDSVVPGASGNIQGLGTRLHFDF